MQFNHYLFQYSKEPFDSIGLYCKMEGVDAVYMKYIAQKCREEKQTDTSKNILRSFIALFTIRRFSKAKSVC